MRKPWTQREDDLLKMLKQDLKIEKWAVVSKMLAQDYGVSNRTQKQCRERYHNHLDRSLKNGKLTKDKEIEFFRLHDQFGNKWALIAGQLTGLTDNYLKNILHSKLRGAVRKLNRTTRQDPRAEDKAYPLQITYRVIDACEKYRQIQPENAEQMNFCLMLKNKLLEYNGTKTVHRLFDGKSEQEMGVSLKSDLEYFLSYVMPELKGKKNNIAFSSVQTEQNSSDHVLMECKVIESQKKSTLHEKHPKVKSFQKGVQDEKYPDLMSTNESKSVFGIAQPKLDGVFTESKQTWHENDSFIDPLMEVQDSVVQYCYYHEKNDDHQLLEMLHLPSSTTYENNYKITSGPSYEIPGLQEDWLECLEIQKSTKKDSLNEKT